jgi:uncharacterized Zn finger protein
VSATSRKTGTYSRCRKCGHREEGVCGVMYGHKCAECGAVDAAKIVVRKEAP